MDISQLSRVAAQAYPWHCCDSSSVFRGHRGRNLCLTKQPHQEHQPQAFVWRSRSPSLHVLAHHATVLGMSDSHGDGLLCQAFDWRPAENYHSVHYGTIRKRSNAAHNAGKNVINLHRWLLMLNLMGRHRNPNVNWGLTWNLPEPRHLLSTCIPRCGIQ
jgi:hypothetical protein